MNFVSGGLRKSANEEKQEQEKGGGDSDYSDEDTSAPSHRTVAPRKLQMVIFVCVYERLVH